DTQRLLKRLKILWSHQDRGRLAVPCDGDTLMGTFNLADHLRNVVADLPKRDDYHDKQFIRDRARDRLLVALVTGTGDLGQMPAPSRHRRSRVSLNKFAPTVGRSGPVGDDQGLAGVDGDALDAVELPDPIHYPLGRAIWGNPLGKFPQRLAGGDLDHDGA